MPRETAPARFIDVNADGLLNSGDTEVTEYTWDARNRLVTITDRATADGAAAQVVHYLYDVENRWIGESIDTNGDGQIDHETRFAYDGNQIIRRPLASERVELAFLRPPCTQACRSPAPKGALPVVRILGIIVALQGTELASPCGGGGIQAPLAGGSHKSAPRQSKR